MARRRLLSAPSLIKPSMWPINPTLVDPAWRWAWNKLATVWLPWAGDFGLRDLVNRDTGSLVDAPALIYDRYGAAYRFDGSNDRIDSTKTPWSGATAGTWVLVVRPRSGGSAFGGLWSQNNGQTAGFYIGRDNPSALDVQFKISGTKAEIAAAAMTQDRWHVLVCTYLASTYQRIYLDGIRRANLTASVPASISAHTSQTFGFDGQSLYASCDIACAYGYTRSLGDTEVALLARDPFGPFRPARRNRASAAAPPAAAVRSPYYAHYYLPRIVEAA